MGGLLNPSIILQGRPAEIEDPIKSMEAVQRVRQLAQQNQQQTQLAPLHLQAAAQTVESQGLTIAAQKREAADQEAIGRALGQFSSQFPNDPSKLIPAAQKEGVSAKGLLGLQDMLTKRQQSLNSLDESTLTLQQKKADLAIGHINAYKSQPDEFKNDPANLDSLKKSLQPLVNPDVYQNVIAPLTAYPGDKKMELGIAQLQLGSAQSKQALDERKIKAEETTANARALAAQTQKDVADAKLPGERADALMKSRLAAAPVLAAAAKLGPANLEDALNVLPRGVAQVFEGKKTPDEIMRAVLTPEQTASAAQHAAQQQVELLKVGISPDDAKRATDPNIDPTIRAQAVAKIREDMARLKVSENVQSHILGELGVMNAMMGLPGGGAPPVNAPAQRGSAVPPAAPATATPQAVNQPTTVAAPTTTTPSSAPVATQVAPPSPPASSTAQPVATPQQNAPAPRPAPKVPSIPIPPATPPPQPLVVQPGQIPPKAKTTPEAIASGDIAPTTARYMLRRNPMLLQKVLEVDPNFDEAKIEKRYSTLKEFTSSSNTKAGGQVLALNTLIHHADLYLDTAKALENGTFTPGNAVYNEVAKVFGSAPPTKAALVGQFLAGETAKVATGGVPAEGEIKRVLSSLSINASPKQIQGAADSLLSIAAGRMIPLKEKRDDANLQKVVRIVGPDAQQILQKRGYDPETMKKTAESSYALIGTSPDGTHKIGSNDKGKTWYDVSTGKKIE